MTLCLQGGSEIDEQVAATDQIHARQRRIYTQNVTGKHAHLTNVAVDLVAGIGARKEPPQPLRGNTGT